MEIGIIGLGHIGGSLALAIKDKHSVWAYDTGRASLQKALELSVVNELKGEEALKEADLIFIATPVHLILDQLPHLLDRIGTHTTLVDVGSTKKIICDTLRNHPKRSQFVASHPMAGKENSGVESAEASLFENKVVVLCEPELSGEKDIAKAVKVYEDLNMRIIRLTPEQHDTSVGYLSHLPHAISFSLANTILEQENDDFIYSLASGGLSSTSRLAMSSPEMWTPIFEQNREEILKAIASYEKNLQAFSKALKERDSQKLYALFSNGNKLRKIFKKQ